MSESDDMATASDEKSGIPPGGFQPGYDPRRGHGPAPGSGGRPSNAFRIRLQSMVSTEKAQAAVQKVLEDPDHRHFAKIWSAAVAQAHGNPAQPHTGEGGEGPIDIHVTHEIVDPGASAPGE